MTLQQRREVRVEQHVPAQDEAGVARAQEVAHPADRAAGVQQLGLHGEAQAHARGAVTPRGLHQQLRQVVRVDHHLLDAVPGQERQLVGDQRDPAHRQGWLGAQLRERTQAGPEPRRHDHAAHGSSGSWKTSSASGASAASRAAAARAARRSARMLAGR